MAINVDEQGRLYLPKDIRRDYGEQFRIVRLHDGIKLLPVPEDPVEDLADALEPLTELSPDEVGQAVEEEALKEILEDLH